MARPGPVILAEAYVNDSNWEVLEAPKFYVLTYKNKPVGIRIENGIDASSKFKYKKTAYPNLGSVKRLVKLLNEHFFCDDFSYMVIGN